VTYPSKLTQIHPMEDMIMFNLALTFFIIAIIAGILGLTGIAGTLVWAAKILFFAGLILAVVFFLLGRRTPPI
jgi:uncharacterized membrane protein YtjA (UPF0391 family)